MCPNEGTRKDPQGEVMAKQALVGRKIRIDGKIRKVGAKREINGHDIEPNGDYMLAGFGYPVEIEEQNGKLAIAVIGDSYTRNLEGQWA